MSTIIHQYQQNKQLYTNINKTKNYTAISTKQTIIYQYQQNKQLYTNINKTNNYTPISTKQTIIHQYQQNKQSPQTVEHHRIWHLKSRSWHKNVAG